MKTKRMHSKKRMVDEKIYLGKGNYIKWENVMAM